MAVKLLNIPCGNVCRVLTLGPMEYPLTTKTVYKLLAPLLIITWQMKSLSKTTLQAYSADNTIYIPTLNNPSKEPSIAPSMSSPKITPTKGTKRRKQAEPNES